MRKTKEQKAITLIALIITIVVLLILAAVAIASITNDGVLSYVENATTQYNQAVKNEQDTLQGYIDYLNKHNGGTGSGSGEENGSGDNGEGSGSEGEGTGIRKTVAEVKNEIQTSNTKVVDEFGNQIVVPAGFKIRVDEDAGTKGDEKSTATNVTEGIVIEDASGNQFVWVPVGKIYTDVDKTESLAKTITLGRYIFDEETGEHSEYPANGSYAEETVTETGLGRYGNAIARNIEEFVTSATQNEGYYIGRFEAGNVSDKLVCKTGQTAYVDITQPDSSTLCKNMYNNGADGYKSNTFSSDLINSYAWDTAIIFIQTFGGESNYANANKCTRVKTTGGNQDEYCNINDMSGNAHEWTTETYDYSYSRCVSRGGYYYTDGGNPRFYTSFRCYGPGYAYSYDSFRPLLYVAL